MDSETKRMIDEAKNKPVLIGNYIRNSKRLSTTPVGAPCRRLAVSYEPLRKVLAVRGLSWRKVIALTGISINSAVALSKDHPVCLDVIATVCYYLSLTPNEVLEFAYVDSVLTKEDAAGAHKRLGAITNAAKAKRQRDAEKDAETEELYAGGLHTPLHALNAGAVISEQERQKKASRKEAAPLPKEEEKPASTGRTEGQSEGKKNAEAEDRPSILFGD